LSSASVASGTVKSIAASQLSRKILASFVTKEPSGAWKSILSL
jgi:hypothetical protein